MVHKKIAKKVAKLGKKVGKLAGRHPLARFLGLKTKNSLKKSTRKFFGKKLNLATKTKKTGLRKGKRPILGSRSFPSGVRIRMGVAPTPSDSGPRSRKLKAKKRRRPGLQ